MPPKVIEYHREKTETRGTVAQAESLRAKSQRQRTKWTREAGERQMAAIKLTETRSDLPKHRSIEEWWSNNAAYAIPYPIRSGESREIAILTLSASGVNKLL